MSDFVKTSFCSDVSVSMLTHPTEASSTASASFVSLEEKQFPYQPTSSDAANVALATLRERLAGRVDEGEELRLLSMKEKFDLKILTRFYDELMVPNFPLEDERDDLQDWLVYLDPNREEENEDMDVLILMLGDKILGGIAFEYYCKAQVGLLSYVVVSDHLRRLGILGALHPVFVHAMQALHEASCRSTTKISAILAETNTVEAGDVPVEVARFRHQILYKLGYRLLHFPYVQPPLTQDAVSFDDIMLLVYVGDQEDRTTMSTPVLYEYVVDFYYSVFSNLGEFQDHWYYRLATWFAERNPLTKIQSDLPWDDVTPKLKQLQQQQEEDQPQQEVSSSSSSMDSLRQELFQNGFVRIPKWMFCLCPDQVDVLQRAFSDLFDGQYETGIYPDEIHWRRGISRPEATREICNGWKANNAVADAVRSEKLGTLACSLMGWRSSRLAQDDVLHKSPNGGPVGFHQDGAYISNNFVPLANNCLTMWMALDDADSENGALQYAPGSHLWKDQRKGEQEEDVSALTFHVAEGQDHLTSLRQAAVHAGVDPAMAVASVVTVPVKAGEMVVHHQDIWHGSGPNESDLRTRRALVAHLLNGEVQWRADRPHYIYGRYYIEGESIPRTDFFPFTHFIV